ncbi:CC/Se motif family (seleno)protein [Solibacillus sp. FSL R5-0691]|uniref:CC/Se motif family (seleno)protein n=1 Tax=Solibacillus sp. FSL R5-0691 TaxID=2921653 RepID=UPI0030D113A3
MQIELDATTKKWMQAKGKPVSVKTISVNACCAPPVQELMTHLGKPKDVHNYNEFQIDNLCVYVEKSLSHNEKMTLKLTGIGIFKMISAKLG